MAEAEPALTVPETAPALRDVASAPPGEALVAYETQSVNADELLKQFLNEISDVARDAEVGRHVWSGDKTRHRLPTVDNWNRALTSTDLSPRPRAAGSCRASS